MERIKPTGAEKGNYLKWLRAGSPVGEGVRVARRAQQLVAFSDNGCVYSMFGFDLITARDGNIELVRLDHTFQDCLMVT